MIINLNAVELKEAMEHYFNNLKFKDENDLYIIKSVKVSKSPYQGYSDGLEIELIKKEKKENKP